MTAERTRQPELELSTPVQFVPGIGPRRAELLEKLKIRTASDLLFFFPRDYAEGGQLRRVEQLEDGVSASVRGIVEEIEVRNTGAGKCLLGALVREDRDYVRAIWFNQPQLQDRLRRGMDVLLTGVPRWRGSRWELTHPRVEPLVGREVPVAGGLQAVYRLTEGLNQWRLRKLVRDVLSQLADRVDEVFPEDFRTARGLLGIGAALRAIHDPPDRQQLERARRRFIYQELLVLQLALTLRKQQRVERCGAPLLAVTPRIDARIRRLFPFELTAAQKAAIEAICADMARPVPMHRLLQGDVGSGKTVVAEYAMLLAVALQHQAVLMAPTEILAQQHFRTVGRDLRASRVRIALLTGSLAAAQRRETLAQVAAGEVDLVVGTHALLHDDVCFARLGLVVIDEQHKFGVRQRAALRRSGTDPHYLVMTATPIPRTISLTLFGDLDSSELREAPPNRSAVHTYRGDPSRRDAWWDFFRRKLREGRQGYVIVPRIEGDESAEVQGVLELGRELAAGELADFQVGVVHGRMSSGEKDRAMQDFAAGTTQVLVATPVVEVGVDIPNATLMTIEAGERFGLAQLHQLRGRVSRGRHAGYVCVFAADQESARERLDAFSETSDGFALAELDFRLRGPGTLFSFQQHGLPPFRIADLVRDADCVSETRADAQSLVAAELLAAGGPFAALRQMVVRRYGKVLELVDAG